MSNFIEHLTHCGFIFRALSSSPLCSVYPVHSVCICRAARRLRCLSFHLHDVVNSFSVFEPFNHDTNVCEIWLCCLKVSFIFSFVIYFALRGTWQCWRFWKHRKFHKWLQIVFAMMSFDFYFYFHISLELRRLSSEASDEWVERRSTASHFFFFRSFSVIILFCYAYAQLFNELWSSQTHTTAHLNIGQQDSST